MFNDEMKRRVFMTVAAASALASWSCLARPERSPGDSRQGRQHAIARLLASAREQAAITKSYDPRYVRIAYPRGDVPPHTGVCSDVIIRAFRALDIDLQQAVHEDMRRNFAAYPRKWGLNKPDPNIDHRRVPNLMKYFERQGKGLVVHAIAYRFQPGDIVAWDLGTGQSHIGIISDERSPVTGRPLVFHNIGNGVQHEDVLLQWGIMGHYRYW